MYASTPSAQGVMKWSTHASTNEWCSISVTGLARRFHGASLLAMGVQRGGDLRDDDPRHDGVVGAMTTLIALIEARSIFTPDEENVIQKAEHVLVAAIANPRHLAAFRLLLRGSVKTLLCIEPHYPGRRRLELISGATLHARVWTWIVSAVAMCGGSRANMP